MDDIGENDFTEKMLVKQLTSVETSLISCSLKDIHQPEKNESLVSPGAYSPKWFRLRRKAYWLLQGLPLANMETALTAISMSQNKRSRENLLDTVQTYGEGNWCYEFSHQGIALTNQVKQQEQTEENKAAIIEQLNAARMCFNIASYPHLKGDKNADKAQTLGVQTYREMLNVAGIKYKELSIPCSNGNKAPIKAWLHLPKSDEPVPMIITAGSYETLFSDFYLLYSQCLAPRGIAMLTLDNPHCGQNSSFDLDFDCSILHRETLDYIVEHEPAVDSTRIGALGFRFGGNIVTRLSYMRSKYIKATVCVGPAVNRCFVDKEVLDNLPLVMKASLANRLNRDVADWDGIKPILSQFSLKVQGLLGAKNSVPIAAVGFSEDPICDKTDLKLLADSSAQGKLVIVKKESLVEESKNFYEGILGFYSQYMKI